MLHSPVTDITTLLYPSHTAAICVFNFDNSNCLIDDFFFKEADVILSLNNDIIDPICMHVSYCYSGSGAWLGVSLGQSHLYSTTTEVAWGWARLRSLKSTDFHKMKRRQSAKIREHVELMLSLVSFTLLSCLSAFKSQITWLHEYEVHDAPHPTFTRAPSCSLALSHRHDQSHTVVYILSCEKSSSQPRKQLIWLKTPRRRTPPRLTMRFRAQRV